MQNQFFDIHTHVNFAAFDTDREEVIKRAREAEVGMINIGTQQDTSRSAVSLAEKYEGLYATVGLHPVHTSKSYHDEKELGEGGKEFTSRGEIFDYDSYKKLALHPKVLAIGECGLDYYRENQDAGFKIQEKIFRQQIELAIEVNKPLMLHVRNGSGRSAYRDALSILKSYIVNHESTLKGDFHFFAGSWEEAREIIDCGFNLSFTGVITFARDYDEVIKNAPLDRILSETDSPYVAPSPFRGKRNEPLYVIEVVKKIAEIRGEDFEIVKKQLTLNATRFFGLF
ncbi:MAG: TatD family hydrolase [bacterium]|nr:TatD family hydrolase [bacterium]